MVCARIYVYTPVHMEAYEDVGQEVIQFLNSRPHAFLEQQVHLQGPEYIAITYSHHLHKFT